MIIQVMYRDPFRKDFNVGPYTYICNIRNVNIGDIAVVETKFGISLAQIHKINLRLTNPDEEAKLKEVLEICNTQYPMPEEVK